MLTPALFLLLLAVPAALSLAAMLGLAAEGRAVHVPAHAYATRNRWRRR